MPPRIQSQRISNSVLPYLSSPSTTSATSSSTSFSHLPTSSPSCPHHRTFTSTPTPQTRLRAQMFDWINSEGRKIRHHEPGLQKFVTNLRELSMEDPSPEQMSIRPFPLNPNFTSESILSEELRGEIYRRVVQGRQSVKAVSFDLKVDIRRVAAVVRLVELERQWKAQVCFFFFALSFTLIFLSLLSFLLFAFWFWASCQAL